MIRKAAFLILIVSTVAGVLIAENLPEETSQAAFRAHFEPAQIAGRNYRWPGGDAGNLFPESVAGAGTNGWISRQVWAAILETTGPLKAHQRRGYEQQFSIFKIHPLERVWHQPMSMHAPPGYPSERPPVLKSRTGGMAVWKKWSKIEGRYNGVYVTYSGRGDIYVDCGKDSDFGSARGTCRLHWNDDGVVHAFTIYGDHVERAPRIVEVYGRLIGA